MFGTKKNENIGQIGEPNNLDDVLISHEVSATQEKTSQKSVKPSVISEGFVFDGNITSSGQLTVDGTLTGSTVVDSLIIGVNGSVGGIVNARSINVKGTLSGTINCSEILIGGRSVVDGNLTYSSITIQRGGVVKGDIRKSSTDEVSQSSSDV